MKINKVISSLMKAHTDMSSPELEEYNRDMDAEYDSVVSSKLLAKENAGKPKDQQVEITWRNRLKTFFENPYTRTFNVILYWWLFRKISDWKNGTGSEYDDDDDDDDLDEIDEFIDKKMRARMRQKSVNL